MTKKRTQEEGLSYLYVQQQICMNISTTTPGQQNPPPFTSHDGVSDVVIESTRMEENIPGYRFRYGAQVFLVRNKENPLITCLDTGCLHRPQRNDFYSRAVFSDLVLNIDGSY
jgi:hypothetical protein